MLLIVIESGALRTYHAFSDREAFGRHSKRHLDKGFRKVFVLTQGNAGVVLDVTHLACCIPDVNKLLQRAEIVIVIR